MNVTAFLITIGCAAGLLFIVAPLLWPRSIASRTATPRRDGRLRTVLNGAGYARVSTTTFVAGSLALALGVGALVFLLTPVHVLAMCAALAGGCAPLVFVARRRAQRIRQQSAMWPDVADTLISLVRSGASIVDAVAGLGDAIPGPIGVSARAFALRTQASANVGECLSELKADWADPAGDRIVEALRVTRDVGGTRLTTVLRELSHGLRRDLAVRREVEARQSWIRVAAGIGAAAPWAVVVLLSTRSEAAVAYQSVAGTMLIVGGLVISVVAYQLMIRIGRLRPQRRWFA